MTISKDSHHDAYTVGWICALHEELTAAKAMLDERHERLPQPEHDDNSYILGEISGHTVVIACLPSGEYGTNAAASVATQMRSTFSGIQFLMMVGIGGGVPETADIRLGDVVVSTPTGEYGGVVQFDLGKTVGDGHLVHTGMLNRPPQKVLTAVGNLRSERAMGFDRMSGFLGDMVKKFSEMSTFQYPVLASDNLYRAEYEHCGGYKLCDECCDQRMLVSRNQRPSTKPRIHYGLIASGNQVIKHAASRARIAEQYKILCFEMEAAGVMNQFPCLVIRGICDYADSHKNKQWQCYAAATAAAYAKELLGMVQTSNVTGANLDDELSVLKTVSSADDNSLVFQGQQEWEIAPYSPPQSSRTAFFERLSDYDPYRTCQDYLRRRCPDTTKWVLNHAAFQNWLHRKAYPCLWLSGKIGCGKTLVTSTAVRFIESSRPNADAFIAHFFFSHSDRARLSAKSLFESFVKQILEYMTRANKPYPKIVVKRIKSLYNPGSCPATLGEVVDEIFLLCCHAVPDATYVIDGLDECERSEVILVFGVIRKMIAQSSCRVLVSARDGIDLVQAIPQTIIIAIADQGVDNDIRKFIDWQIAEKFRDRTLTEDGALLRDIKTKLAERADHMILWVKLQLELLWEDCYTDADIRLALENLPRSLSETYDRCISRINAKQSDLARRILYWVSVAIKPFDALQLQEALSMDPETGIADPGRMLPAKEIVKLCCHLIICDTNGDIRLAHASVDQFLQERSVGINQLWGEYTLSHAKIELADLCLTRLLPLCCGGMLERYKGPETLTDSSSVLGTIKKHIPFSGVLGFSRAPSAQIPWPPKLSQNKPSLDTSAFLQFAQYHWALLTDSIDKNSMIWRKFRRVALVQKPAFPIHPWGVMGDSVDSHYVARLAWAISQKHRPLFSLLVGPDRPQVHRDVFDVPLPHYDNLSLLHLAARSNFPDAVTELLPDPKHLVSFDRGRMVLHHAAAAGSVEAINVLVPFYSKYLDDKDANGHTPLHLATVNNRHEMVALLMSWHARANTVDKGGQTPLVYAVRHCDAAMVQLLIPGYTITSDGNSSLRWKDVTQFNLLHIAAERLDPEIISLLKDFGADVEAVDTDRRKPQDVAAESFLKASMLSIHARPVSWVFFEAIKLENILAVQCLLQLGAYPDCHFYLSPSPVTALEMSLIRGNSEITNVLLASGYMDRTPYARFRTMSRDTALLQAFEAGVLVDYPAILHAVHASDIRGFGISLHNARRPRVTPSIVATLACIFGHTKVIEFLHEQGYSFDADYIMWTLRAIDEHVYLHLLDRTDWSTIRGIFKTRINTLRLLRAIAKAYHRADVELALLNIRFKLWLETDLSSGTEQDIAPPARSETWI
ncbi:hypothetical protein BJX65DRAFT_26209 [Aspergillus insuetus]